MNTLFPMPAPKSRELTSSERARLLAAGCSPCELAAVVAVSDPATRALLIEFFCDACPLNWRKLELIVSLMLWKLNRGDRRPIGGDIITNAAKFCFPDCGGNNDHRLLYARALCIVRPDLREMIAMEDDAKANVLFECGWLAPDSVNWKTITPAKLGAFKA